MNRITAEQIRAARAMLRMSAQSLAQAASIGVATVRRSEAETGAVSATAANIAAMKAALEAAGIEFIPEGEGGAGAGVRLRSSPHPYAHFPFPIFDFDMPFGAGRFGVYRNPDETYTKWHSLTLLQLADPHQAFESYEDIMPFWYETLNSGSVLEDVLVRALELAEGPRKPLHPSELLWHFHQPENVYPGAREFVASLSIDWARSPARLNVNKCTSNLQSFIMARWIATPPPRLEWWRLDPPAEKAARGTS